MSKFKMMGALITIWCAMMLMAAVVVAQTGSVGYQVASSYFESNQSGLKGENSYLVFTKRADFDKVFGAAALMGKNSFLPDDAFQSKLVVAVVKRGGAIFSYKMEGVEAANGALTVRYKATAGDSAGGAMFASPLIIAVDGNSFNSVTFIENGKTVGVKNVAGAARSTPGLTARGAALVDAHKDAEAIPILLQAIKLNPKDSEAHVNLGVAYDRMGQGAKALAEYQESVRLRPNFRAYRNLGASLSGMERYEEAEAALKEAIRIDPNEISSYGILAFMYSKLGRNSEASSISQKAVRIAPREVATDYMQRGRAFQLLGLSESALADFEQALILDPQNNDVRDERAFSSLILGRGAEAAALAAKSLAGRQGNTTDALYPTFVAYFGSRMAGKEDAAANFLKQAEVKGDATAWPFPVIRHLRGELTAAGLLELAKNNAGLTEANTYIGLKLTLDGQSDKAMPYLRWAEKNGVRSYAETVLARAQLARMEQTAGP